MELKEVSLMFSQGIKGYSEKVKKEIEDYANRLNVSAYVLSAPLIEKKYASDCEYGSVLLIPGHKIIFIDSSEDGNWDFDDYMEDTLEDIGSVIDQHEFKDVIGRVRIWRRDLVRKKRLKEIEDNIGEFLSEERLKNDIENERRSKYIIGLFIGSINDVKNATIAAPKDDLESVKHKIQLFDCDQTRFIYYNPKPEKKVYEIQGLSGTGKTELLLHKLRDIYVNENDARIGFTCYSRVLASNFRKRIPAFFNYMNVRKQIDWDENLICANAWGQYLNRTSGIYRYVCSFYGLPFFSYKENADFNDVCRRAIERITELKAKDAESFEYAFQYMFIDESQDFQQPFFDLCELVTEKHVYKAGDIFQSIFATDDEKDDIKGDLLLGKCYRTAPKTFMVSQALGWGLFEKPKIRWLSDKAWEICGYELKNISQNEVELSRRPIRRFDGDNDDADCFKIVINSYPIKAIVDIISNLKDKYDSLTPDDICVIFIDPKQYVYDIVPRFREAIYSVFGWETNISYETKKQLSGRLFVTNSKNVKGLEYPFVICYTNSLKGGIMHRNLLYTMISRSLLSTYLIIPDDKNNGYNEDIRNGLSEIMEKGKMTLIRPTEEESKQMTHRKMEFQTTKSLRERVDEILEKMGQPKDNIVEIVDYINKSKKPLEEDEEIEEFINDLIKMALI